MQFVVQIFFEDVALNSFWTLRVKNFSPGNVSTAVPWLVSCFALRDALNSSLLNFLEEFLPIVSKHQVRVNKRPDICLSSLATSSRHSISNLRAMASNLVASLLLLAMASEPGLSPGAVPLLQQRFSSELEGLIADAERCARRALAERFIATWTESRSSGSGAQRKRPNRNKKLLETRALLLGTRTLLGAPGLTTRSKKLKPRRSIRKLEKGATWCNSALRAH